MKKIALLFMVVFLLFGCSFYGNTRVGDTDEPVLYVYNGTNKSIDSLYVGGEFWGNFRAESHRRILLEPGEYKLTTYTDFVKTEWVYEVTTDDGIIVILTKDGEVVQWVYYATIDDIRGDGVVLILE